MGTNSYKEKLLNVLYQMYDEAQSWVEDATPEDYECYKMRRQTISVIIEIAEDLQEG